MSPWFPSFLLAAGISVGCAPAAEEPEPPTPDPNEDNDGDGYTLAQEQDCGTDPENGDVGCFDCGHPWDSTDQGPSGNDVGDIVENFLLRDTCGDDVELWNFAGDFHVLYLTGAW